ncbi:mannosylinositol phosphorylceramide synthase catalytic subunit SUR1 NDAI_0E02960 [Naumovozyma dairenensis CBS 421]|uniref:inositol phosphorylceramide mannosyltransferase n=1 Tax=Naumovozyma dairenensis (strain ATCC 10597 / BCRC 20456 / CBS 421 / NBRC 0211 / NRRL Y-12639) TaxID=1071378 RepID=G0WBJ3_NAUDC|nr:hypothetical protein NDAI_0E02960 [Naumovozyma dairenensis CBS 421]CCD25113.1 hypothetical protein NDAI_0E02960 [Naumovozyma dairenensis CBS 421]
MRKELKFLIYSNILLWVFIVYYTFDLLMICIDDTTKEAFTDDDLNNIPTKISNKPQLIPKIIHQTYKTTDIPKHWKAGQQRCIDLHPDYEYILWTDEMALDFIKENYHWFLPTFKNYKYPIQRADAIRYFILLHYGGVYIDLDDGCERRLDPLLTAPVFLRKTSPIGVSNDVMGSVPRHPFFLRAIKSLEHYNKSWYIPYMTIMSSTGPLFISIVWKQYKRWTKQSIVDNVIRIIQPDDYKMTSHSFFSISKGSSWHMDDAAFMKSLENHILSCVVAGFIAAFFVLYFQYCFYCFLCASKNSYSVYFFKLINLIKNISRALWTKFNSYTKSSSSLASSSSFNGNYSISNESLQMKRLRKDSNAITLVDLEKNPNTGQLIIYS